MKEAKFQTQIKHGIDMYAQTNGCTIVYRKEPDMGQQIPYDCFVVYKGIHIAMELKVIKTKRGGFNFKAMFRGREHQIPALLKVNDAGGVGWVIIYNSELKRAFAISATIAYIHKNQTVPLDYIEEFAIDIPRIPDTRGWKGRQWDISFLFDNI